MTWALKMTVCTAALLACSGCVTRNFVEHLGELRPGDTLTQVQAVLGPPNTVKTDRSRSAWLYCDEPFDLRPKGAITVWFVDRQLVEVSVYQNQPAVACHDFLQTFTWDHAPSAHGATFK